METYPKFHNSNHFKTYWEKGNGKDLLHWTQTKISIDRFKNFAHLYHQIDDLADEVVKETYLKLPYHEASKWIETFSKNKISSSDNAPKNLKKFFLQLQQIPDWFQPELANIGARFCMRTGTNALIILRDFTLMGGYDFAYLNKPLVHTGALKKGAVKRLKDTLEFWIHVTRENALQINSEAYQLIIRTRLMHAYARLSIQKRIKNWDFKNWGQPINHWDMIATYIGFSLVFMQGLQKLGLSISENEEMGVFHLWKYIGYLLGIPTEYLPENKEDAVEIFYLWTTLQAEGDADSAQLAKALLDENINNTIYPFQFQRKLLLSLHKSMNIFLLDKEIVERLEIPKPIVPKIFPKLIVSANKITEKIYNLKNPKKYQKLVDIGNKNQMKVLEDYIKHTPKDFHY